MRNFFIYSLFFAVFLALSGCVAVTPDTPAPSAAPRACVGDIELAGRFSVRYWQDGREEAAHGSFRWRQAGLRASITLLSLLGQTLATIELAPGRAMLTLADQPPRVAADADALAAQALGWPLPVSGLRDWLQGCARLADGGRFVAAPGREQATAADGWRLNYPVWERDGDAPRPKRIDLERPADDGGISLRLVIDDWQPGAR
ncbi:MAG: outer rane lipoprotein LolB [Burkholderiaceae bacterium]|nr:outer rane lipoprotein LolB [Burkholderiaceae bacterium]